MVGGNPPQGIFDEITELALKTSQDSRVGSSSNKNIRIRGIGTVVISIRKTEGKGKGD